ncbi:serine hydrolase domain-containing protein [Microbacterium capsulatum]|uniref:Serine hydrolase domain-containing protein n=1 Tax=Microbacterium capsulatum TaxID=3041921 RepID=A0ABU0XIE6_9MICO|nr:serine hydrolase domain-containing protein [Microbacterium sp. ASV81]MDQ4214919.1 serine hydrolase domain-containing protein [Microbacterium sp. ASV81]
MALALVLTGCGGGSVAAPTFTPKPQVQGPLPNDVQDQLKAAVQRAMAASGSSGAIVGVWAPWSGSWVVGLGTVAPGDKTPVKTDMSFRIADVTRMMTCDVLYALADRDIVKLDDKIPTYVSGVPDLSDVSLLDLCDGTAGIGSSASTVMSAWLNNPDREWEPKELASYGLGQSRTPAHTAYRDSDAGYLLLGLALERATGRTAAQLIREYVTSPLGLSSTSLPGSTADAPQPAPALDGFYLPQAANGAYACDKPADITVASASMGYTASGVVSTIDDLGRYAQAAAVQALRVKDTPKRFGKPLAVASGAPSWYQATGGAYLVGSLIGQHGAIPGYLTAAYSDPASGFTVAVVLNDSSAGGGIAGDLAWELSAIASKAPPAKGRKAPAFALPFTADDRSKSVDAAAICHPAQG